MSVDRLSIWTIYERPKDFPDCYVARRFEMDSSTARPTGDIIKSGGLEALRRELARMGLTRIERAQSDEPQIVDSWL